MNWQRMAIWGWPGIPRMGWSFFSRIISSFFFYFYIFLPLFFLQHFYQIKSSQVKSVGKKLTGHFGIFQPNYLGHWRACSQSVEKGKDVLLFFSNDEKYLNNTTIKSLSFLSFFSFCFGFYLFRLWESGLTEIYYLCDEFFVFCCLNASFHFFIYLHYIYPLLYLSR